MTAIDPLYEVPFMAAFAGLSAASLVVAYYAREQDSARYTLLALFVAIGTMVIALTIGLDICT